MHLRAESIEVRSSFQLGRFTELLRRGRNPRLVLYGLTKDPSRVRLWETLLHRAILRNLWHEGRITAKIANQNVGCLSADRSRRSARQQHDDAHNSAGVRHRRLSLALSRKFEVVGEPDNFGTYVTQRFPRISRIGHAEEPYRIVNAYS